MCVCVCAYESAIELYNTVLQLRQKKAHTVAIISMQNTAKTKLTKCTVG